MSYDPNPSPEDLAFARSFGEAVDEHRRRSRWRRALSWPCSFVRSLGWVWHVSGRGSK